MRRKEYYSLSKKGQNVTINIYGDITKYSWWEEDYGATKLARDLEQYDQIDNIDVFINSNGGSVSEGLAIYNILQRHPAKVTTYCDGFACSAASVVFMAGDERIMSNASLLMIHNAWMYAEGNAEELRKLADDLEKITDASVNAYMNHVNISRDELKEMMDNETWIDSDEALEKGFCTSVVQEEQQVANQSVSMKVKELLSNSSYRLNNNTSDVACAGSFGMSNTGITKDLFENVKLFIEEFNETKAKITEELEEKKAIEVAEKKKENKYINFFKVLAEGVEQDD